MAEEQPPEVKAEAREFMKGLVGSPPEADFEFVGGDGLDMAAWKATYASAAAKDASLMEEFWSRYNPKSSSIWTMVYDEADSNENFEDTVEIVKEFMKKTEAIKDHCFGVMHVLDGLEIQGLWIFNGPDPEQLFGANEDTSWFTWNQLGPEVNDLVKQATANYMAPSDNQLDGKTIQDTQAFE